MPARLPSIKPLPTSPKHGINSRKSVSLALSGLASRRRASRTSYRMSSRAEKLLDDGDQSDGDSCRNAKENNLKQSRRNNGGASNPNHEKTWGSDNNKNDDRDLNDGNHSEASSTATRDSQKLGNGNSSTTFHCQGSIINSTVNVGNVHPNINTSFTSSPSTSVVNGGNGNCNSGNDSSPLMMMFEANFPDDESPPRVEPKKLIATTRISIVPNGRLQPDVVVSGNNGTFGKEPPANNNNNNNNMAEPKATRIVANGHLQPDVVVSTAAKDPPAFATSPEAGKVKREPSTFANTMNNNTSLQVPEEEEYHDDDDVDEIVRAGNEALLFIYGHNPDLYSDVFQVPHSASLQDLHESYHLQMEQLHLSLSCPTLESQQRAAILCGMKEEHMGFLHPINYCEIKGDAIRRAYDILGEEGSRMEYDGLWREFSQDAESIGQSVDESGVGQWQPIGVMIHGSDGNDDEQFFWNGNDGEYEDQDTVDTKASGTAATETLTDVSDGLFEEANNDFWSEENTTNTSFTDHSIGKFGGDNVERERAFTQGDFVVESKEEGYLHQVAVYDDNINNNNIGYGSHGNYSYDYDHGDEEELIVDYDSDQPKEKTANMNQSQCTREDLLDCDNEDDSASYEWHENGKNYSRGIDLGMHHRQVEVEEDDDDEGSKSSIQLDYSGHSGVDLVEDGNAEEGEYYYSGYDEDDFATVQTEAIDGNYQKQQQQQHYPKQHSPTDPMEFDELINSSISNREYFRQFPAKDPPSSSQDGTRKYSNINDEHSPAAAASVSFDPFDLNVGSMSSVDSSSFPEAAIMDGSVAFVCKLPTRDDDSGEDSDEEEEEEDLTMGYAEDVIAKDEARKAGKYNDANGGKDAERTMRDVIDQSRSGLSLLDLSSVVSDLESVNLDKGSLKSSTAGPGSISSTHSAGMRGPKYNICHMVASVSSSNSGRSSTSSRASISVHEVERITKARRDDNDDDGNISIVSHLTENIGGGIMNKLDEELDGLGDMDCFDAEEGDAVHDIDSECVTKGLVELHHQDFDAKYPEYEQAPAIRRLVGMEPDGPNMSTDENETSAHVPMDECNDDRDSLEIETFLSIASKFSAMNKEKCADEQDSRGRGERGNLIQLEVSCSYDEESSLSSNKTGELASSDEDDEVGVYVAPSLDHGSNEDAIDCFPAEEEEGKKVRFRLDDDDEVSMIEYTTSAESGRNHCHAVHCFDESIENVGDIMENTLTCVERICGCS